MSTFKPDKNASIAATKFELPIEEASAKRFTFGKSQIFLISLALLILLFIVFISFAKSISIQVKTPVLNDPTTLEKIEAKVRVNSLLKLPIADRVMLWPGEHVVDIEAEGFNSAQEVIAVAGDQQQDFELVVKPTAGSLRLAILPALERVEIRVDGQAINLMGDLISAIPAGKHTISVDAPLYRSATQEILIEGRGREQEAQFSLSPAWGMLSLQSEPAGAEVLIDGVSQGYTPIELKVEEGRRELRLQLEKYKAVTKFFTLRAGDQVVVPPVELVAADATLKIQTDPPEAAIIYAGVYRGNSPIEIKVRPDTTESLQVYKAGFQLYQTELALQAAQVEHQNLDLKQDLVSLRFSISPQDAELYIDDERQGSGSQTVNLNTLPHRILVKKKGYVSYSNVIVPSRDSEQVVSVKLLSEYEAFWANLPLNYQTRAGQTMKLFKSPGKVLLGSARSETGRRSNEVQYQAKLDKHFYVSLHEVTNKQFRLFRPAHSSGNYKGKSLDGGNHPAVNVSWQQAALYCNWLSEREGLDAFYQTKAGYVSGNNIQANGYRLLTEAEWAWLARNKDGSVMRYGWGNDSRPRQNKLGNYADSSAIDFIAFSIANYTDGYKASAPVGRFEPNHRGLFDLDGNAAEWVNDWYSALSDIDDSTPPLQDPMGPDIGEFHVIRGASWARGHLPQVRLAYRDFGAKGKYEVGFRIARYVGEPK